MNAIGQRTAVSQEGTAFESVRSVGWGYDPLGQVVKADSTVAVHNRSYEYDMIGNRKKSADSLTLPATDNYTANSLNQYTAIHEGGAGVSPVYDLDGNATAYPLPVNPGSNSTLTWDAENRLTSATANGATTTYQYDAQSRRIAQGTGSASTLWIYDGWNPVTVYSSSLSTGNYLLKTSFTWGTDLSGSFQGAGGVGGLLSATDHSALPTDHFFPTYDGNGNVSEYLDATGSIAAHYEYDPFGRTVIATGPQPENFAHRSSTKPLDQATGFYYYGYRFYDPVTGRWPSRDPIAERGGVNLYQLVLNNPLLWVDFLGLKRPKCSSPDDQEEFDKNWEEAKKNGGEQTKKDLDTIDKSPHDNSINTDKNGGSDVRSGIGQNPDNAHNGKGHGTHTNFNPNQSAKYSGQSVFEHEMNHVARRNEGNLPHNTGEREKLAIDAANEGRRNRGEDERPYSDHERITPEQAEEWEKEKCECPKQ